MKSFFFSFGFLMIFFFGNLSSLNNNLAAKALESVQLEFHHDLAIITTDIQDYIQKAEALSEDPVSIQDLKKAHPEVADALEEELRNWKSNISM